MLMAGLSSALPAGVVLEPSSAPEWKVSEWINGDPGKLANHRGKIVLIDFFQLWCPGCNEFSIPLFQEWEQKFGVRNDVLIVSIHTVFEGHEEQTPERLREFVTEKGITHPVGIDAYAVPAPPPPVTMDRFETGGTPHIAIVDREGRLRFSHFGRFDPQPVERFIERLFEEKKSLNIKSKPRDNKKRSKGKRTVSQPPGRRPPAGRSQPANEQVAAEEPEDKKGDDGPDKSLSGSYKLRFEPLSRSCGDVGQAMEVITQVVVKSDGILAKFSRPYLGVRQLNVSYDAGSGDFAAEVEQQATEKGGVAVELSLQMSGRFISIVDPPEIEYDYYLDKRSEDGSLDCVIEGRGGGARFRPR
jgi:thiol-disulfide isomerase/thioredoxin